MAYNENPSYSLNATSISSIVTQVFTSSGTYTPTSGMKYCIIEVVGGGGGGGGTAGPSANFYSAGGGGGAGSYARKVSSAATIGASQTVTIGAAGTGGATGNNAGTNGGDTSLGSICIGKGGTGGSGSPGNAGANGGAGGVAGTGDLTFPGERGGFGIDTNGTVVQGNTSHGGNSFFGAGGAQLYNNSTTVAGDPGSIYGTGGGGGCGVSGTGINGGNGAAGVVIVTEYI